MDFGSFFSDIARNVGNFLGFNKKDEEEERNRPQYTPRAPQPTDPNRPDFRPMSQRGDDEAKKDGKLFMPTVVDPKKAVAQQQEKDTPGFWSALGAGLQQMGGQVADTAIQGGVVAGSLANELNPFLSDEQRQEREARNLAAAESVRGGLQAKKDISGQNIIGNTDVDEAASRIASGRASVDDYKKIAGRGLDVANTVTSLVPVAAGYNAATKGARVLAPVARETAVIGSTGVAADIMNDRGVTPESLLFNYGVPGVAGLGGAAVPRAINAFRVSRSAAIQRATQTATRAATATDSELGALGNGLASSNVARVERNALSEAAQLASKEADDLARAEAQVARQAEEAARRVAQEAADVADAVPPTPYTTPKLQRVGDVADEAVGEIPPQRLDDAALQPETVQEPIAELPETKPVDVIDESAPLELAPTPFDEPMVATTPDGTAIRGQTLETAAKTEARQAADQAAPISPENIPEPMSDMRAREAAQPKPAPVEKTVEPFKIQDANQETLVHARGWNSSTHSGVGREKLENAGDIFRELAGNGMPGYIGEKIYKIRNYVDDSLAGKVHPDDRFDTFLKDNPERLAQYLRMWQDQPVNTPAQQLAKDLNIALVEGDLPKVQKLLTEIENLPKTERGIYEGSQAMYRQQMKDATPTQAVQPAPVDTPQVGKADVPPPTPEVDPRIVKADKKVDAILADASKELGPEGGSYATVARKLYNNSDSANTMQPLTDAEQKVAARIRPELDAVVQKMNDLGLTDTDMGYIVDYLPTKKLDEFSAVNSVDDVAAQDFGFTKKRTGALSPEEVEAGAEQALRDYLRTGELLDELSPEQIADVKLSRRGDELNSLIETDVNGGSTGMKLTDAEIADARVKHQKLNDLEAKRAELDKKINSGKADDKVKIEREEVSYQLDEAEIQKKVDDYMLLEKKTDEAIENIKRSNDPPDVKQRRITQLDSHLQDVRNNTYYLQSSVRTNLLFGVGRIADQVNKLAYGVGDKLTAAAKLGGNKSFKKAAGRNLYGDSATTRAVWDQVKSNPRLNTRRRDATVARRVLEAQDKGKSPLRAVSRKWREAGTYLTEAGSRYKIVDKDTVSYFTSQAQQNGITDPAKIAQYINGKVGTTEWNRIHQNFFDARNAFTGLPTKGNIARQDAGGAVGFIANKVDIKDALYNTLRKGNVSRRTAENIADGITIPLVGFPRLVARIGSRGFDMGTLGTPNFIRAARIKPKNEAEALRKALYVQQGFRDLQTGPVLGAAGVSLGAANMVTGAYPDDASERARWKRDGIQPYSLKLGDQYIQLGRYLGPAAFPLMVGAAAASGENPKDAVVGVTKQILDQYGADSVANVLEQAAALLKGDLTLGGSMGRTLAGITDAFIPAGSLLNTVGKAEDMFMQRGKPDTSGGYTDALRARLPLVRAGLPEQTDTFGNPITQGTALNLMPGISGGQKEANAATDNTVKSVESEIDRLAGLGFEVMPSKQATNAEGADKWGGILVETDLYKNADDEKRAEYLDEVLKGTTMKEVNENLDDAQKSALLQYSVMDGGETTGERGVWLEDAANARDYYTAKYANEVENGTLTEKQDNLQDSGSLHYKAVASQVNVNFDGWSAELELLYKNTSEKELYNMPDDDPNKQLLLDLDAARAEAGVSRKSSDKSKAKYDGITSGSYRGGRSGSRSGGKLSLPTIAAKPPTSGTQSLASLELKRSNAEMPTVVQKAAPKRRRGISVKKGVSL